MNVFWFYLKLGLQHVLDINAYDHILFLTALVLPFTFKSWKKVVLLATVFTITHCLALVISVYEIWVFQVKWIEFLIPVTILMTAIFNLLDIQRNKLHKRMLLQVLATGCFGFIHGFGFSNYFKMMVMAEEGKVLPLIGFASGIEVSQVIIVIGVLLVGYLIRKLLGVPSSIYIKIATGLVILFTIPLVYNTFPF